MYHGRGPPKPPRKQRDDCNCKQCFKNVNLEVGGNSFWIILYDGKPQHPECLFIWTYGYRNVACKTKKGSSPSRQNFSVTYNILVQG